MRDAWEKFSGRSSRLFFVPDSESRISHNELIDRLGKKEFSATEGHFGIGNVLMNLRIIAGSRQSFGILADGYPGQVKLFDSIIDMLADPRNKTRQNFFDAFEQEFKDENKFLFEDNPAYFRNQLAASFPDEESYRHVRGLAQSSDLVSCHVNLFDSERVSEIVGALASSGRTLGTVYLTNLTWFLKGDEDFYRLEKSEKDIEGFWDNIEAICNGDRTLVCDAQHEQKETVYSEYDRGYTETDSKDYVQAGSCAQRRERHMERRQAYANHDRHAFSCP